MDVAVTWDILPSSKEVILMLNLSEGLGTRSDHEGVLILPPLNPH